jgi:uncharacterized protein YdhG (YjbR/CyaY superfamily)
MKFPLDEPIPYELIARIVKSRVREHGERLREKRTKK